MVQKLSVCLPMDTRTASFNFVRDHTCRVCAFNEEPPRDQAQQVGMTQIARKTSWIHAKPKRSRVRHPEKTAVKSTSKFDHWLACRRICQLPPREKTALRPCPTYLTCSWGYDFKTTTTGQMAHHSMPLGLDCSNWIGPSGAPITYSARESPTGSV